MTSRRPGDAGTSDGLGDREHVAVGVGVVLEHLEHGGAAGPHAGLVVAGDRRAVHVGALGEGVLEGLLGALLVALELVGLLGRGDLLPVVDEPQVGVDEPRVAVGEVVEHDRRRGSRGTRAASPPWAASIDCEDGSLPSHAAR